MRTSQSKISTLVGTLALGLSYLSALNLGCTATDPTEVVGGVNTQIKVPDYIKTIGMLVQVAGTVAFCNTYSVENGLVTLPGTLGILDRLDEEIRGELVTLQVLGLRVADSAFIDNCIVSGVVVPEPNQTDAMGDAIDREVMVLRRRRFGFVEGQILFQNMPLKESCRDKSCGENETCVGGVCAPIDIKDTCPTPGVSCGEELPVYSDSLAFGTTNTCFNADACMDGASVPAYLEDPDNCTFVTDWPSELPLPNADDLNVKITYDSFGTEILDRDPDDLPSIQREGFSQPDPDNPLKFQLAPNLCESNYKTGRIVAVESSGLCPAKRALQPLCESYEPPLLRNPETGLTGMCTLATLEPVESAVYVLMDQSDRMFSFYGDGPASITTAIDLPLANPSARQTQIALGLIPAPAAQCGSTNYTPTVPFGPVAESRGPIGNVVSNPDTVLPADDMRPMSLQAALQGAYAALSSTPPLDENGAVSRRSVIVISNRDVFADACDAGPTSEQLASTAAAAENAISTYAVALGDGDPNDEDPTADQATLASATALAAAGGTEVYNGVANELEGATAVAEILNELATCQYAVTRIDLGANTASELPDLAVLSYVNPLQAQMSVVDIPRNSDCTATSGDDESGWNIDGNTVRICGDDCTELRRVTFNVTGFQFQRERVSPPIPLVVSAPCADASFTWAN